MNEQVALAQETNPRAYESWTPEADLALLAANEIGMGADQLARIFKRSPGAVRSRLRKLLPPARVDSEDTLWEHQDHFGGLSRTVRDHRATA